MSSNILSRMEAKPSKDFHRAMTPMKTLSWLVGTWPLQRNTFATIRSIITILILLLMFLIMQMELYLYNIDAEQNMEILGLLNCIIMTISKVMCYRIRSVGLLSNLTSAIKDYNEASDEEKRVIMRRHARMGKIACAGVIFCSYFGSTVYMAVPMMAEEKKVAANVTKIAEFPLPSEHTMQSINMPRNLYPVVFFAEFFMLLVTSTANLGSDSLFFAIAFHLCGQVEILKVEFARLVNESEKTVENFIVLIKRHIYLLNLARMLNDTISAILIVQLFTSCSLICAGGIQVILLTGNLAMVIKAIMILGTLFVQLFAYCYVGEYLMRQVEGIGHSLYFCTWYEMPKNVTKHIIYIIMRAQDPIQLTAGKFFIVNMETFMNILKTSMSFFSVIRVVINA